MSVPTLPWSLGKFRGWLQCTYLYILGHVGITRLYSTPGEMKGMGSNKIEVILTRYFPDSSYYVLIIIEAVTLVVVALPFLFKTYLKWKLSVRGRCLDFSRRRTVGWPTSFKTRCHLWCDDVVWYVILLLVLCKGPFVLLMMMMTHA